MEAKQRAKQLAARIKKVMFVLEGLGTECTSILKELEEVSLTKDLEASIERAKGKLSAADKTLPMFPSGESHGSSGSAGEVVSLAEARENRRTRTPDVVNGVSASSSTPSTIAGTGVSDPKVLPVQPVEEASPKKGPTLRVLQDRLVALIDENEEALRESIEAMGCGGDCYKCPHPDFPEGPVYLQVRACLKSLSEGLGLPPEPLLTS